MRVRRRQVPAPTWCSTRPCGARNSTRGVGRGGRGARPGAGPIRSGRGCRGRRGARRSADDPGCSPLPRRRASWRAGFHHTFCGCPSQTGSGGPAPRNASAGSWSLPRDLKQRAPPVGGGQAHSRIPQPAGSRVLDLAWCEGALWFHRGVGEPLDTIAVAELEVGLQVLLRAKSSSGATRLLKLAFKTLFDLDRGAKLPPLNRVTVEQFIAAIAEARSGVLHGRQETTGMNVRAERADATMLAEVLLAEIAVETDRYFSDGETTDTPEALLRWIGRQRAQRPRQPAWAGWPQGSGPAVTRSSRLAAAWSSRLSRASWGAAAEAARADHRA